MSLMSVTPRQPKCHVWQCPPETVLQESSDSVSKMIYTIYWYILCVSKMIYTMYQHMLCVTVSLKWSTPYIDIIYCVSLKWSTPYVGICCVSLKWSTPYVGVTCVSLKWSTPYVGIICCFFSYVKLAYFVLGVCCMSLHFHVLSLHVSISEMIYTLCRHHILML